MFVHRFLVGFFVFGVSRQIFKKIGAFNTEMKMVDEMNGLIKQYNKPKNVEKRVSKTI